MPCREQIQKNPIKQKKGEQKMNEIQIRAVIKQGRCKRELYTSFCRKQQLKIEVLYNM
jgi:transcription elongation factor 1-like protein